MPNPAPVDPDIVGALVSGEYCGTPFVGRVHALDAYGHAEIDVPFGWMHMGRDYSDGIMTDAESLTIVQPRKHGKVTYANDTWTWIRSSGKPWPRNRRNPGERPAFKYRYLGTDDEESVCGCCGRQDLKRVAWLVALDEDGNEVGQPVAYGTTCAGQLLRDAYSDRGKKKPTKGQSEKLLEEARQEAVNEAWHRAESQGLSRDDAPEPVVGENAYGVPTITRGPTVYVARYEQVSDPSGRFGVRKFIDPRDLPLQLEASKTAWYNEERLRRARAEASRMGLLDVQTWEIQRAATQKNPREDRLLSRIGRA